MSYDTESAVNLVRISVPLLRKIATSLPSGHQKRFSPETDSGGQITFRDKPRPNWYQIPDGTWDAIKQTPEYAQFLSSVRTSSLLTNSIGKTFYFLNRGMTIQSEFDVARHFFHAYLTHAGVETWKPSLARQVWSDTCNFLDASRSESEFQVITIAANFPPVAKRIQLDEDLEIRTLSAAMRADLASLDARLAGFQFFKRIHMWPGCYLIGKTKVPIHVREHTSSSLLPPSSLDLDWCDRLNDEIALLRVFLRKDIASSEVTLLSNGKFPAEGSGICYELPWSVTKPFNNFTSRTDVKRYQRDRKSFLALKGQAGWTDTLITIRRFARAWENPWPADVLADLVAALEGLIVGDKQEVSYKLRTRLAHFIGNDSETKRSIVNNVKNAYAYRSRIFHGDYVFDRAQEWSAAKSVGRSKGKSGNPFHDVNEIVRLTREIAQYYQRALKKLVRSRSLKVDWESLAL